MFSNEVHIFTFGCLYMVLRVFFRCQFFEKNIFIVLSISRRGVWVSQKVGVTASPWVVWSINFRELLALRASIKITCWVCRCLQAFETNLKRWRRLMLQFVVNICGLSWLLMVFLCWRVLLFCKVDSCCNRRRSVIGTYQNLKYKIRFRKVDSTYYAIFIFIK